MNEKQHKKLSDYAWKVNHLAYEIEQVRLLIRWLKDRKGNPELAITIQEKNNYNRSSYIKLTSDQFKAIALKSLQENLKRMKKEYAELPEVPTE